VPEFTEGFTEVAVTDFSEGTPVVGRQVKDWDYGRGVEGTYVPRRDRGKVMILGGKIPWWMPVIKRIGLTPTLVILSEGGPKSVVVEMSGDVDCIVGQAVVTTWMNSPPKRAKTLKILFCQGRSPPYKAEWWRLPLLELVVSEGSAGGRIPTGWKVYQSKIKHSVAGGVSDYSTEITIHVREERVTREFWEADYPQRPAQDLRSIVKMGRSSSTRVDPPASIPSNPGESVIQMKNGPMTAVELHGLFPKSLDWSTKTRARLGGDYYFLRELSTDECLQVMDVPEKLFKHASEEVRRDLLQGTCHPLKVLQEVAERVELWMMRNQTGKHECSRRLREVTEASPQTSVKRAKKDTKSLETPTQKELDPSEDREAKASKVDKARIPVEIWDEFLSRELDSEVLKRNWKWATTIIRGLFHRRWIRNVTTSYFRWRRTIDWTGKDVHRTDTAARDAIQRAVNTTCWEWKGGSRPFFWRWPSEFQQRIMEGTKPWISGDLPEWKEPQRLPHCKEMTEKMVEKLRDVLAKGYLEPGKVTSLMFFFGVDKNGDIRMVYDGTRSGLNDVTWAPWFPLPVVDDLLDCVDPGTFMGDNDVGEMFLNFIMHSDLREVCGIDLTDFIPEGGRNAKTGRFWVRWCRNAMGLKGSPYFSVQGGAWAHEWIYGAKGDDSNIFRWKTVKLNLPGHKDYNPSVLWVRKEREDGTLASELLCYVDDERVTGSTDLEAWIAGQRVSSGCAHLGLQDAARKRRPPSQTPGSWAGSDVHTIQGRVSVLVSQARWDGMKTIIREIQEESADKGSLAHKDLERKRGKLVYGTRGYNAMKPYLKGIHLTLDGWRRGRDKDGWKLKASEMIEERELDPIGGENLGEQYFGDLRASEVSEPPSRVRPVTRLASDLRALASLLESDSPTKVVVRANRVTQIIYGFGDASGKGWGASILLPDGSVYYKSGTWFDHVSEKSSNFRELANLVFSLREAALKGLLDGGEVFMFTDNTTAERAFFRGTSKSRKLFDLILELRQIEMRVGAKIHMVHVAGTRMIYQGTDGLSRGDQNAGVMTGEDFLSHVPLHLSCLDRRSELKEWINDWATDSEKGPAVFLTPEGWFEPHQVGGCYIWTPPPAAARRTIYCLGQSILKRPKSVHVVLIPRLMTALWRKVLEKTCDLSFTIPAGSGPWGVTEHEPLLLTIALPLSRAPPWRHKRSPLVLEAEASMHGVWKENFTRSRDILRKLVSEAWRVADL
jgi:hypothetical protein